MEELVACANPDIEVLVIELDREPEVLRVETDRRGHVRRAQLRNNSGDRHGFLGSC